MKIIFGSIFLVIFYLWSGGLYEYKTSNSGLPQFRINKVTGNIQILDNSGWNPVIKDK
jgi:hypothetical protein